eukprot:6191558-Pleurochrysis_carterae.AAC.1
MPFQSRALHLRRAFSVLMLLCLSLDPPCLPCAPRSLKRRLSQLSATQRHQAAHALRAPAALAHARHHRSTCPHRAWLVPLVVGRGCFIVATDLVQKRLLHH